jgi:hypothetical protein
MDLKEFLTMFVGNTGLQVHTRSADSDGVIEEHWIDPLLYDSESIQAAFAQKSLDDQRNMWFQVGAVEKGSKASVLAHTVWADLDIYKYPGGEGQVKQLLRKFPKPTVIVSSGSGWHVYWRLKEPLDAKGQGSVAQELAKSVQYQLGADAAHQPSKLLRIPGTYNFKPDKYEGGKEAKIIEYNDVSYLPSAFPRDDVLMRLPHNLIVKIVSGPSDVAADRSVLDLGWLTEARKYGLKGPELTHLMMNYTMSGKAGEKGASKADYVKRTVFKAETSGFQIEQKTLKPATNFVGKSITQILEEDKPAFLIEDFLTQAGIAMISAPPKARKSWCVMQMAYGVATGTEWLGFNIPTAKKVAYVQAELPNWMVAERMIQLYGVDAKLDNITFFHVPAANLVTDEDMSNLVEAVESSGAELVIIDPIANFWQGDENSSSSVNRMFDQLAELQKRNVSVVLVHHARKTEANERLSPQHQRGSNVFFARPDAIMTLSPYELPGESFTWADFALRASKPKEAMKLYTEETGGFSITPPTMNATGVVAKRMHDLLEKRKAAKEGKLDDLPWNVPLGAEFTA